MCSLSSPLRFILATSLLLSLLFLYLRPHLTGLGWMLFGCSLLLSLLNLVFMQWGIPELNKLERTSLLRAKRLLLLFLLSVCLTFPLLCTSSDAIGLSPFVRGESNMGVREFVKTPPPGTASIQTRSGKRVQVELDESEWERVREERKEQEQEDREILAKVRNNKIPVAPEKNDEAEVEEEAVGEESEGFMASLEREAAEFFSRSKAALMGSDAEEATDSSPPSSPFLQEAGIRPGEDEEQHLAHGGRAPRPVVVSTRFNTVEGEAAAVAETEQSDAAEQEAGVENDDAPLLFVEATINHEHDHNQHPHHQGKGRYIPGQPMGEESQPQQTVGAEEVSEDTPSRQGPRMTVIGQGVQEASIKGHEHTEEERAQMQRKREEMLQKIKNRLQGRSKHSAASTPLPASAASPSSSVAPLVESTSLSLGDPISPSFLEARVAGGASHRSDLHNDHMDEMLALNPGVLQAGAINHVHDHEAEMKGKRVQPMAAAGQQQQQPLSRQGRVAFKKLSQTQQPAASQPLPANSALNHKKAAGAQTLARVTRPAQRSAAAVPTAPASAGSASKLSKLSAAARSSRSKAVPLPTAQQETKRGTN